MAGFSNKGRVLEEFKGVGGGSDNRNVVGQEGGRSGDGDCLEAIGGECSMRKRGIKKGKQWEQW